MKYQNSQKYNIKAECNICPRNCKLSEGQRGFCQVRQNVKGEIELTTYGYNTGLAIDPIEKKPLYHFHPNSKVLSFGTVGCNLGCKFCQNYTTSKTKIDPTLTNPTSPKQIAELALKNDCKSVAFTYNEPTIFLEYATDTAKECKKLGIKTIAVTAGYITPAPREEFFKYIDATNIDLKSFSAEFYKKNCLIDIGPVIDTIKYVKQKTNTWLELTTLLIEGENDKDSEIEAECNWIIKNLGNDTPLHFSAFYPCFKFKTHKPTSAITLLKAYEIAKSVGLKHVYTGNIINFETSATYCLNCNKPIIIREGYNILKSNIDSNGNCKYCNTKLSGYFD